MELKYFYAIAKNNTFGGTSDDLQIVYKQFEEMLETGYIYVCIENKGLDYTGLELYNFQDMEVYNIVFLENITDLEYNFFNWHIRKKIEYLKAWDYGEYHDFKKIVA